MQHIIEVTSLELSSGFPCWFLFVCPLSNARNYALLFALYLRNGWADFDEILTVGRYSAEIAGK